MKWTTIALLMALMGMGFAGNGQITLRSRNASLQQVLADIEKQTKYVFLYDLDELKLPPISISIKNASLRQTLEKCFEGRQIEFTIVGNNVLLKRAPQQNPPIADRIPIHGKVVDETGQPMQGVSVFNRRGKTATQTDTSGAFIIPAAKGDFLTFSFVGYQPVETTIRDQPSINISLEINPSGPDQVVVVGYGISRKGDLTGAVSVVDTKNMAELPFNTVDNALAGKAAGVQITRTDGSPGGMVRVRIRGASSLLAGNDPLYVIDGVPVQVRNNYIAPDFSLASPMAQLAGTIYSSSGLSALPASFANSLNSLGGLNPDDIESISILKDASSAAIYGSKAANGVVLITTKSGKTNMAPRIDFSYSTTVSSTYKTPRLLNAPEFKTLLTEAAHAAVRDDSISNQYIDILSAYVLDTAGFFGAANTNWIKQVTRTTVSDNVGLSIAGGGPTSKFFSSLAYNNTPGVVDGTGYRRISGKFNGETQIGSRLRFAINLLSGFSNQDVGDGAYAQAMLARPDKAPRTATGGYTPLPNPYNPNPNDPYFVNPVALLAATNNAKTLSILGSFSGSYAISKQLKFRTTASLNLQNYNQLNFVPGYIPVEIPGAYRIPYGVSSNANSRFTDWFLENTLSFNRQLNEKQNLTIVAGQSYESTKYSYFTATAGGYPNNNFNSLSTADTILNIQGDDPSSPQSYLLSFYVRTNYSFLDKYLFTFTGRADGSSKFGAAKTFDYFPSGAVAWRISRETPLTKLRWLNDLKLRASYGLTGNQNIGDQTKHTLYSNLSYAGGAAVVPTVLGNNELKAEITKQTDIGLDVSLFADRLYATFDYYNRQTGNAILTLPTNPSTTYATVTENAAGIRNRGFEVNIGGDILRTGDFKWAASVNAAWNRSLVTRLAVSANVNQFAGPSGFENIGGNLSAPTSDLLGNTALIQGKPLGLITGYQVTGILKTQAQADAYNQQFGSYNPAQPGDPMYKNVLSYGRYYAQGNVLLANGAPTYFGGMTQEFSYKNFDLQCLFSFSMGGHLLWAEQAASFEFVSTSNANVTMLNRFTPSNPNTNHPRLDINSTVLYPSNLDVFSSSYVKLRSIVLGYRFDQARWIKRTALKNARIFLSATNVFTITKYPGSDPETSDDAYSVAGGYIDAGNYPAVRTFTFGLKTGF